jgi:rieske iron-sulfur protein
LANIGKVGNSQSISRRDFLKLMAAAGTIMTFAPFVDDWSKFLPNIEASNQSNKQKVELPDGTTANVKTFPINSSQVIVYPKTDDPLLNKDAFRTWQFIRLPRELGGDRNDVSAFRVYSAVCLTCGAYGSTGQTRAEREVSVHVMEACMTH